MSLGLQSGVPASSFWPLLACLALPSVGLELTQLGRTLVSTESSSQPRKACQWEKKKKTTLNTKFIWQLIHQQTTINSSVSPTSTAQHLNTCSLFNFINNPESQDRGKHLTTTDSNQNEHFTLPQPLLN